MLKATDKTVSVRLLDKLWECKICGKTANRRDWRKFCGQKSLNFSLIITTNYFSVGPPGRPSRYSRYGHFLTYPSPAEPGPHVRSSNHFTFSERFSPPNKQENTAPGSAVFSCGPSRIRTWDQPVMSRRL